MNYMHEEKDMEKDMDKKRKSMNKKKSKSYLAEKGDKN